MKTKHYLIVSGAVVIGIIIGVLISTGIMRRQHVKMMSNQTEMQMGDNDFGRFHQNRQGRNNRGMQMGNKNGMGRMGNRFMLHQQLIDELELSQEQQEQMDKIMVAIEEEQGQMKNVRESKWAATQVEIKSVLDEDQIKKMEEITDDGGSPKIQRIMNQLELSDDQKEKIKAIWERNLEMSKGMQNSRQVRRDEHFNKIKSILTEEQIEKFDEFKESNPRKGNRRGGRGRM